MSRAQMIIKFLLVPVGIITSYALVKLGMNQTEHLYSLMAMWLMISAFHVKMHRSKLEYFTFTTIIVSIVSLITCDLILSSFGRGKGRTEIVGEFLKRDKLIGATLSGTREIEHRAWNGDLKLYDVKYNIVNGRRVTKTSSAASFKGCIIFLGDSLTFGHGVNDKESFPYLVSEAFPNYKTLNLATPSHGPHQTLYQLQRSNFSELHCDGRPTYINYSIIYDHFRRVLGSTRWALEAPRYTLEGNTLQHSGQLCDHYLGGCKGYQYTNFLGLFNIRTVATLYDLISFKRSNQHRCYSLKLTSAILRELNSEIKRSIPNTKTTLNIFDMKRNKEMFCGRGTLEELSSYNFDNILDFNPELFKGDSIYDELVDRHPTPSSHEKIANKLIKSLRAMIKD